nr:hypothetical protein CFP56_28755 [Quercus suber]
MRETTSNPDEVLPGTTVPLAAPAGTTNGTSGAPTTTTTGPIVNGKPTILTRYEPAQLAVLATLPAMQTMLNHAFRETFLSHKILSHVQRLRDTTQFLEEIGTDAGTFTYVLTFAAASTEIIATASAHRYVQPVLMAQADEDIKKRHQTFTRFQVPESAQPDETWDVDVWELKTMAVALNAQRQGLAGLLMRAAEDEVKARFRDGGKVENGARRRRCVMLLSTIMELNGEFYKHKGYVCGSQKTFPAGHLGSEAGFTIGHFSKVLVEI